LRALLAREGPLEPARVAEIIYQLATQLDAALLAGRPYVGVKAADVVIDAVPGQADKAYVPDFLLTGPPAMTPGQRAHQAQRALADLAVQMLTGASLDASLPVWDQVLGHGLPPATASVLIAALAERADGFASFTGLAQALARSLGVPLGDRPASGQLTPPQAWPAQVVAGWARQAAAALAHPRATLAAGARGAWAAWQALAPRSRRRAVVAAALLIPALAISLPLALASSTGLNERAWQGWPGAPAVGTLAASVRAGLPGNTFLSTNALGVSPDGSRLLIVDGAGGVREWDLRSGAARTLPALAGYARLADTTLFGLAISPDLTTLAAADTTDVVTQQAATGHQLGDARFSFGRNLLAYGVPGVAFSPDGRLVAYNDSDGKVYLLNVATQQQQEILYPSHAPPSYQASGTDAFAFSPDGATLAAGTEDGMIYLWSLRSGELLAALTDPNSSPGNQYPDVNALAFGAHGALLVAGNLYGTVSVWSVAARRLLGVLPGTPASNNAGAEHVAFSPDAGLVAAYFGDDSIRVWSAATGRRLAVLPHVNGNGGGPIAFALGGRLLVILGGTGGPAEATEWTLTRS
jgi:hypothetical protein